MSNKLITVQFSVGGIGQSGLSPIINIYQLNALNPNDNELVVIDGGLVEIGQGWYRYDFATYNPLNTYVFTIDGGSSLVASDRYKYGGNESYVEEISSEVWEEAASDHLNTGSTGEKLNFIHADTQAISLSVADAITMLDILLKYETNRTRIDKQAKTLTVYDDDGTTILRVFKLKNEDGIDTITDVFERKPVEATDGLPVLP